MAQPQDCPINGFSKQSTLHEKNKIYNGLQLNNNDIDLQIERIKNFKLLSEDEVRDLCYRARDIFIEEGNMLDLSTPITVCGDIHGQFHDLLELFNVGGDYKDTKYLFLGDFVDRGFYSVETFIFLILLKVKYPHNIFLIRGNHECRQITQAYGFYDECVRKYGSSIVWMYCTELFDYMSLSALIDGKVFCVHGGLSPSLHSIDHIRAINRKQEVPHDGIMCDLLWSDPDDIEGWILSPRGAGYQFGGDIVEKFNHINDIQFICRAHQLVNEGYRSHFDDKLHTIWSAPNYCYRCGNVASILKLDDKLTKEFIIFDTKSIPEKMHPERKVIPEYFL